MKDNEVFKTVVFTFNRSHVNNAFRHNRWCVLLKCKAAATVTNAQLSLTDVNVLSKVFRDSSIFFTACNIGKTFNNLIHTNGFKVKNARIASLRDSCDIGLSREI